MQTTDISTVVNNSSFTAPDHDAFSEPPFSSVDSEQNLSSCCNNRPVSVIHASLAIDIILTSRFATS